MSNGGTSNNVNIQFEFGQRFRRQVEKGSTDPLTGMIIQIDGDYIFGNAERDWWNSSYMSTTLLELLEATDDIKRGNSRVVEFANGPTHLVLEPQNKHSVSITGCLTMECIQNPENRTETEVSRTVLIEDWTTELLRAAKEFYKQVLSTNPSAGEKDELSTLHRAIDETIERHQN